MSKHQSSHEVKQGFRTWKSGKSWLYAAGAFIVLAGVVGAKTEISVRADSVTTAPTSAVTSSAASAAVTESSTTGSLSSSSTSEASMSSSQAVSVAKSTISGSSDSPSSSSVASYETSQSSSGKNRVENSNSSEPSQRTTSTSSNTNPSIASSSSATGSLSSNSTSEASVSSNQAVSVAKSTISGSSDSPSSASVAETSQSSSGKNAVENSNSSESSLRITSTSINTNLSTASSSSAIGTSPNNSATQAIAAKPLTLAASDKTENSMTSTTSATYDVSSYVDSTKLNEGTTASGAEVTGLQATVSWGKQIIRAGNSIIEQGEVWAPSQNFLGCTDSDGNSVPWSDKIQVSGSVDFDTPGTYSVEYGFTDPKTKNLAYTLASIIVQPEIVQPHTIVDVGVGYIDKSKSVVASGYMIDPATNGDSFTYPEKSSIAEMDGTARWTLDNQGNLSISAGKVGTGILLSNYDTSNNSASVSSYFGNRSPTRDIVKSITLTGPLQLNTGYGPVDLFSNFKNLTTINGLNNLSFNSDTTDISGLFQNDPLLKSIDLSSLDTSNIMDMSGLFRGDASLSSVNLKGLNTKKVTNMSYMFSGCNSLSKVDLSGFDTSNVTNMSYMFSWGDVSTNNALTNIIGLNHFNTKKVTDFSCMFAGNNALTQLDLSSFDMTSAKSTSTDSQGNTTYTVGSMLSGLTSLKQLSLGKKTVISSDLPNPNVSQDGTYTGAWQNVGTGTLTQPNGQYVLSSAQLSGSGVVWYDENNNSHTLADSSYDGKTMSGIYVWQKAEPTKEEATNNSGIADNGKAVGNLNGTATWKLYNDGTLYIHGGTIAYQEDNIKTVLSNDNANPFWNKYTSQIKNIIIDGNLTSQSTNAGLTLPDNSTSDLTNGTVDDAQEIAGKIAEKMISSMGNEDSASDQANKDLSLGLAKDSVGVLIDFGQALSSGSGATLSHLFANLSNLVSIQGLKNLDTSNVTDMSNLFSGDFKLLSLDLSHFDTKNVVNMKNMFYNDSNLQYISGLDSINFLTTNNYDYSNLFAGDNSLTALNLKNFDMRASLNSIPDSENLYQITYGDGLPKTIIEALTAGWSKGTFDSGYYINYQGKSIIKAVIDTTKASIDAEIETLSAAIAATEGGATPFVAAELAALETASYALGQVTYEAIYDNGNVEKTDINGDLTQIITGNGNQAATGKMLDSTTNLQKLTLGSYTALTNSGLGIAGEEGDQIGSSGYWDNLAPFYTLKWQNFTPSDTTINNPTGTSVKSVSELTNSYTGETSAPSLTYVWQPANYSIPAQDLRVPVGASWNIMDNLKLAFLDGKTNIYLNDQPLEPTDSAWSVNAWYEGINLHQGTDDYFTTVPGNYSIVYSVDGERMTHSMDVNVVVQGKGAYSNTVDKSDNGNVIWNFTGNPHQGDDYDNTSSIVGTYTGTNGKKGIIHLSPFSTDNGDLTGRGDVSGYYSGTDGNGMISGTYNSGILNLIFTPWKVTLTSKNSTLTVGADWKPIDNLKTATDPSGNDLMVNYFSSYSYFDMYEGINLNNEIIPIPGECGTQVVVYNSAGKIVAQDVTNGFDKTFLNTAGTYKVVYQLSVRNADASITTYSTTATLNVVNPQSTNTGTSSSASTSSASSSGSSSTSPSSTGSSNSSSSNTSNAGSSSASSENSGVSTNSNASNSTDNLLNDVSISTNNITINQNATFSMKDLVNSFTNFGPDANGNGNGRTGALVSPGVQIRQLQVGIQMMVAI